jgi:hypothetical protein
MQRTGKHIPRTADESAAVMASVRPHVGTIIAGGGGDG